MRKLVVGSRRSKLALTQSQQFIDKLKAVEPNLEIEIKEIVTKGDRIVDKQLSKVGGKGLFVKEIQHELFEKNIDMAIHSLKDVPSVIPEGLTLGCIPDRELPFMRAYFLKHIHHYPNCQKAVLLVLVHYVVVHKYYLSILI